MEDCCGLSRRQLIQLAAAGAAAGLVIPSLSASRAAASTGGTGGSGLYAQDLELVTVTDTSFVLTWYTAERRRTGHPVCTRTPNPPR